MIESYIPSRLSSYLDSKARIKRIPLNGTFELTPCCNMNCKMCYVRLSKEQQEKQGNLHPVSDWINLAKDLKEKGLLYLLITGGEPFLIPDLKDLLKAVNELGIVTSINSNATLIDEKTVDWLKKYPPVKINITIYGSSNETYKRLCQNPHGFDQVTKAISLLKQAGIQVKVNYSLTPYNKDDLKDIIEFTKAEDLPLEIATYMFPPLRKDETMIGQNARFSPEEAAYQDARIAYLKLGKEGFKSIYEDLPEFLKNASSCEISPEKTGDCIKCGAGKSSFWIDWKGNLNACGMIPSKANNVFDLGFNTVWENVGEEIKEITLPSECSECELKEYCHTCAAMVYTETGCFNKKPVYRCRMAESIFDGFKRVADEIGG